jgi:hypothetical protein
MDYSKGKIYQIVSEHTTDVYIGSTIQPLSTRFSQHKCHKNTLAIQIINAGNARIELIEEYPCQSKKELVHREGKIIKESECINKLVAGRSMKEYYEDNKDAIRLMNKQWRENHKEEQKEHRKKYYQENKAEILRKYKEYVEKNKEKIAKRKKQWADKNKERVAETKKKWYNNKK